MSRRGAYHKRNNINETNFPFSSGLREFHDRAAPLTGVRARVRNGVRKRAARRSATPSEIAQSANGWSYVNGEWIHPDGYKFVRNQVLRTTAKPGRTAPEPPGKLALENAQNWTPTTVPSQERAKTEAERKAEEKRKNLETRPAPQTGTHI